MDARVVLKRGKGKNRRFDVRVTETEDGVFKEKWRVVFVKVYEKGEVGCIIGE